MVYGCACGLIHTDALVDEEKEFEKVMAMEKKKRTDSIVAVTLATYATMYVEADTPEEAYEYAKKHLDEIPFDAFEDSEVEVHSWEAYTTEAEDWMDEIWVEDGKTMTYDEYVDELNEQRDKEERVNKMQLKLDF